MERVLPAVRAELHQLKAFGRVLFLRQRVVPIQALGANISDVITFGDGPNDADMLRNAGVGVAVGVCSDEARNAASYVCEDIDEGGILKACRYLRLI